MSPPDTDILSAVGPVWRCNVASVFQVSRVGPWYVLRQRVRDAHTLQRSVYLFPLYSSCSGGDLNLNVSAQSQFRHTSAAMYKKPDVFKLCSVSVSGMFLITDFPDV